MNTDQDLINEWEESIREAIVLNSEVEADEGESILFSNVKYVETNKDKGVMVQLTDGLRIHITVQIHSSISAHYCESDDMTFIIRDTYDDNGTLIAKECVGWYFGKPNKESTSEYIGKLVADYR